MNMKDSIKKLTNAKDYETAFIGEQIAWHTDKYIKELMEIGLSQIEAENAIVNFCEYCIEEDVNDREIVFPEYREDLVAMIAEIGLKHRYMAEMRKCA